MLKVSILLLSFLNEEPFKSLLYQQDFKVVCQFYEFLFCDWNSINSRDHSEQKNSSGSYDGVTVKQYQWVKSCYDLCLTVFYNLPCFKIFSYKIVKKSCFIEQIYLIIF